MNFIGRKNGRRQDGWRRGGSVLELALTLLILFNLCYGTIEFGYYFFVKNTMQGSAREGARAAIVAGATQAQVTSAVTSALSAAGLPTASFTIVTTPVDITTATTGQQVTVSVTANWGTVGSGFRPLAIIGANKTLTAAAVMRKEG